MASGMKVILGWAYPDYAKVREALGINIPLMEDF